MCWLKASFWLLCARWFARRGIEHLAEICYSQAAAGKGRAAAQASFILGKRLLDQGQATQAIDTFRAALATDPRQARAWCGLGAAHRLCADLPAAEEAYEQALKLAPDLPQALSNLGELHLVQGDAAAALDCFDRALAFSPDFKEAMANRVAALIELGRYPEAEAAALGAIECFPNEAAMQVNYGIIMTLTLRGRPAVKAFRRALDIDPCCAEAHLNLALFFGESQKLGQVLAYIEGEIALKGENAQRLATLALAQAARKDFLAAEKTCRRVLALQPGLASALVTLGSCHSARARHTEAIACYEQAVAANPNMPAISSNICFEATYLPEETRAALFERHRQWARYLEAPLAGRRYQHSADDSPDRPLRLGYVSGDFGRHPVGFLLRDVIRHHDPKWFEVHCFSMMREEDEITQEIRARAAAWHDVLLASDEEVARRVHEENIDILVDLSGHTAYNRLAAFALRPSPVQATWIGYFHSTGLESIDYFITDPHTSPPGSGQLFSETPVYLPDTRFCYSPPDYAPEVAPAPAPVRGYFTFGSFNRLEKLVDPVLDAWAAILVGAPESRLLIKAGGLDNAALQEELLQRLVARGVPGERIELRGGSSHLQMLNEYGDMDLALDTFPFNGGMTTLEALWMGVPVLTIEGNSVVSRQTHAALANLGLTDRFSCASVEDYIRRAIDQAQNRACPASLRQTLRLRMAASPLCQAAHFTRDLEALYRHLWQVRCTGADSMMEPVADETETA